MNPIIIDCSRITCRADLHDLFAQALALPAWYGRNLDALHDCLTSIGAETTLQLQNWNSTESALGHYAAAAKKTLLHAADSNPNLTVIFE